MAKANPSDPIEQLRGNVERIFFSDPRFSAGRLDTGGKDSIAFAGPLMVRVGDSVVLHGFWTTHAQYGRQFQVERYEYDMPVEVEGLVNYLANNPNVKGIGPVKARLIAERFGRNFEQALESQADEIAEIAGVSAETIQALQREWKRNNAFNSALTWLSAFGLTHHQVTLLVEKFENNVVAVLKSNPYLLVKEIRGFGFKRVDAIALKMGVVKDNLDRIRAGISHAVDERIDAGDCWVDYEELVNLANQLLVMDCLDSRERIEHVLDAMIDKSELECVSYNSRFLIARPDLYKIEQDLESRFRQGSAPNPHFAGVEDLAALVKESAPSLNEGQLNAVMSALSYRISLMSGGAGSGKTYTIAAIANLYKSRDLKIILAAPTGKAAKRLEQVVGQNAFTIHRLLGYQGRQFTAGPDEPIRADVVIIDEVSMVDVSLAWHLFRAIDPEKTAVVLVGDHNQLPPVGPGNILRDLLETGLVPGVVLDQVVRQAGVLKENCIAILRGEVRKTATESANGRRPWYLVDQFTNILDIQTFIIELYETILVERLGFDLLRDVQLLSPTKKGPLGTDALNVILQQVIQKKLLGVEVVPPKPGRRPKFLKQDRVIQTRNNYDLDVMNGATGVVEQVLSNGGLIIEFDGRHVEVEPGENMADVSLAYALTVHKVQGSEYPCVVTVIHKAHTFMHNRNLFYTGVTRSRQSAIVIGDQWGLRNCAMRKLVDRRKTFLSMAVAGNGRSAAVAL